MKRIDSLTPGTRITLWFEGTWGNASEEDAVFVRIEGEGETREAVFDQGFEWNAYRYNGHWAYGSGANRLRLVSIDEAGEDDSALEDDAALRAEAVALNELVTTVMPL